MKDELRKALEVVALRDALAEVGLYVEPQARVLVDARTGDSYIGATGPIINLATLTEVAARFGLGGLLVTHEIVQHADYVTDGWTYSDVVEVELRWTPVPPVLETPTGLAGATWEKCGSRGNRAGLRLGNGTLLVPEDLVL